MDIRNKILAVISAILLITLIFIIWVFTRNLKPNDKSKHSETTETVENKTETTNPIDTLEFTEIVTEETIIETTEAETTEAEIEEEIEYTTTPIEVYEEPAYYIEAVEYYEEITEAPAVLEQPIETTSYETAPNTEYANNDSTGYGDLTYDVVDASVYNPNNLYGFSEYEVYLIAKIVEIECGADYICLEQKLLTASVLVNLVFAESFPPTTVEEVIHYPGAYYPRTHVYFQNLIPTSRSLAVANYVVNNGVICPSNVIYEANFPQGSGIYKSFYVPEQANSYPYSYFCYE